MKKEVIGTGMFGTTYLVEKNGKKYALKRQHIHPYSKRKNYAYPIWRELDLFKFINTLESDKQRFFTKMHGFEIYDDCKHVQHRPRNPIGSNFINYLSALDKSPWCVDILMDYKGDITLANYLRENDIDIKTFLSLSYQIINIVDILFEGGYRHGDLHLGNLMVTKTKDKEFYVDGYGNAAFNGIQLVAIDYGEVMHRKFKKHYNAYYLRDWLDNKEYDFFNDMRNVIGLIIFNEARFELRKDAGKHIDIFVHIATKHNNYWQKTISEIAPEYFNPQSLMQLKGNLVNEFDRLSHIEHEILTKVVRKFSLDYPDEYVKADGWVKYHKPILPYKTCVEFLKVYDVRELFEFLLDLN